MQRALLATVLFGFVAFTVYAYRQPAPAAPAVDPAPPGSMSYLFAVTRYDAADYGTAVAHFQDAAEAGHPRAQYRLALCFLEGKGVMPNTLIAARWFRRAADQGDTAAQVALGRAYWRGEGVVADSAEAYKWFQLGATLEREPVARAEYERSRNDLATTLTPADVAEGQRRAQAWLAASGR